MDGSDVLYISVNQTHDCIAVGTETGFAIYNIDPFRLRYKNYFGEGIGIVELLFRSNIVALVGGGLNPKFPINNLIIWDDNSKKDIIQYQMNSKILNVKLNINHLVITTVDHISVYNFQTGHLIRDIILPYGNQLGVAALSANPDYPFIVYPSPKIGSVLIDKLSTEDMNVNSIPFSRTLECHNNAIKCINISPDGKLLVTSSMVGTIIKIYDLINFVKLYEFRRGTESVNIQALEFTLDNKYLILSSNKATIHIYSLTNGGSEGGGNGDGGNSERGNSGHENSRGSYGKSALIRGFLPKYFNSEWSVLTISSFEQIKKIPCFVQPNRADQMKGYANNNVYHLYLFNHNNVVQIFSIELNQKQINKVAENVLCTIKR